ncbi:MAG: hypothetical protein B7Z71_08395 [Acidocella sp. 21-58-7]|nr:MAG: hypothetical protein B7Z71_08395 [Acidocella sp. 21-58-7]
MSLWFDVDDLIRYYCATTRPTGIQRLSFEMFQQLRLVGAAHGVRFCRRTAVPPYFRAIDFAAFEAKLTTLIETPTAASPAARPRHTWLRTRAKALPPGLRRNLGRIARAGREILLASRDILRPAKNATITCDTAFDLAGPVVFEPGDWLVNLGSSWSAPYSPDCLAGLKARKVRFAVLVYDLVPLLFPEWSAPITLQEFRNWVRETLPAADMLLTISRNTAADIATHLGPNLPPVKILPLGSRPRAAGPVPAAQPFVLFVSTIEVRKNHALMFKIWQQLLAQYPQAMVPDLVFAGKRGWLTGDFLQQMENANWLEGKIRFIESPTDAELAKLYQQCLFTVYPSLYEGWGLPVTESLSFGKTVAASNRASIPEAGGEFCTYFDPDNLAEATAVIAWLIMQPERVGQDTAMSLLAALVEGEVAAMREFDAAA